MANETIHWSTYEKLGSSKLNDFIFSFENEHYTRYDFAATNLINTGGQIIDAASGCGWGTDFLARNTNAETVTGLDNDNDIIQEAKKKSNNSRVNFMSVNLLKSSSLIDIKPADNIISYETIEHFSKEEAPIFLNNIYNLHTGDGKLFVSTPNRPLFSPYFKTEKSPWYGFHKEEYDINSLVATLESNGWAVENLYGQRFVNLNSYQLLAEALSPIRKITSALKLPWDNRFGRLPFTVLNRFGALISDEQVKKISDNKNLDPIYLLTICRKTKKQDKKFFT